jgi:hypothetical protein
LIKSPLVGVVAEAALGDPVRLQSPYLPEEELVAVFGARQIPDAFDDTK